MQARCAKEAEDKLFLARMQEAMQHAGRRRPYFSARTPRKTVIELLAAR